MSDRQYIITANNLEDVVKQLNYILQKIEDKLSIISDEGITITDENGEIIHQIGMFD